MKNKIFRKEPFKIENWKKLYPDTYENSFKYSNDQYVYAKKRIIYENSIYIGCVDDHNHRQGFGTLTYFSNSFYQGYWNKDYYNGWGRLYIKGILYEGSSYI
jgi:hypothetical protein